MRISAIPTSPSIYGHSRAYDLGLRYEIEKLRRGSTGKTWLAPRMGHFLAVSVRCQDSACRQRIISPYSRRRTSMAYLSALPTAFEQQVRKLGLDERTCVASRALRLWCEEHKDRCYIPEWLLARWRMTVDLNDAHTSRCATTLRPIHERREGWTPSCRCTGQPKSYGGRSTSCTARTRCCSDEHPNLWWNSARMDSNRRLEGGVQAHEGNYGIHSRGPSCPTFA
jgi:hypothetical protein